MKKKWLFLGIAPLFIAPLLLYTNKAKNVSQPVILQSQAPLINYQSTQATQAIQMSKPEEYKKNISSKPVEPKNKALAKTQKPKDTKAAVPACEPAPTTHILSQKTQDTGRTVTINNTICKDKLGYKHWGIWYHPSKFVVSFNGKVVEQESKDAITIPADGTLKVHYEYEFLGGIRKGWRALTYRVDAQAKHLDIDFNWKDEYPVKISNATPLSSDGKNS